MTPRKTMGIEIPSNPPPRSTAVLSEDEYSLLWQLSERIEQLADAHQEDSERIDSLEASQAGQSAALVRIESKLDVAAAKDAQHDAGIAKVNHDVAELAARAGGDAAKAALAKAGPWGAAALLAITTAPEWLPALIRLLTKQ